MEQLLNDDDAQLIHLRRRVCSTRRDTFFFRKTRSHTAKNNVMAQARVSNEQYGYINGDA